VYRSCQERSFPPSKEIQLESDKINYILSSVFLLANRLSKSVSALAELDNAISTTTLRNKDEKLRDKIDEIIAKCF
jgi:hypothetical protein